MSTPLVTAVMPCLNEERTLGTCIRKAQQCFRELGIEGEVVVADNGSTDGSVALAESLGARVVHQRVRGYGAALTKGIEEARGEIVVMADADDSYDWLAMGPFIASQS
jgi:glycosyltransferase involved in cell wall biosynthesis